MQRTHIKRKAFRKKKAKLKSGFPYSFPLFQKPKEAAQPSLMKMFNPSLLRSSINLADLATESSNLQYWSQSSAYGKYLFFESQGRHVNKNAPNIGGSISSIRYNHAP